MVDLSKEEKRAMKKQWKEDQQEEYLLSKEQVMELFTFLEEELDKDPCNNTLEKTEKWLHNHFEDEQRSSILHEIQEMGGYCDCEVLMNCYEDYDIE